MTYVPADDRYDHMPYRRLRARNMSVMKGVLVRLSVATP